MTSDQVQTAEQLQPQRLIVVRHGHAVPSHASTVQTVQMVFFASVVTMILDQAVVARQLSQQLTVVRLVPAEICNASTVRIVRVVFFASVVTMILDQAVVAPQLSQRLIIVLHVHAVLFHV